MSISLQKLFRQGGPGSGFRGHRGRKDKVGGSLPSGKSPAKQVDMNPLREISNVNEATDHGIFGRGSFVYNGKIYDSRLHHEQIIHELGFRKGYPGVSDFLIKGGLRVRSVDRKFLYIQGEFNSGNQKSFMSDIQDYADSGIFGDIYSYRQVIIENNILDHNRRVPGIKVETTGVDLMNNDFRFVKNSKLFLHGGPGSGFHDHRGRPGEVGGSSKGEHAVGELTPEQREERLRKRRERRARRKEQGKGTQPPQPPQTVHKPAYHPRVQRVVAELGYPVDRVTPHEERGPAFTVNGKTFHTGASFSPSTGEIKIYNVNGISDEAMKGMLSHEIQHSRWNDYKKAYQGQFVEVQRSIRGSDNPEDWFITAEGSVKPQYKEKFWAYDIEQEFLSNYNRWARLQKSDGISAYSKEYWAQARRSGSNWDYDRAVDETLAEIARIQTGNARAGDKKAIRPIWQSLYNRVRKHTIKKNMRLFLFGGEGSGHYDHAGRPGQVGGSTKGEQALKDLPVAKDKLWFGGKYGDEVRLGDVGFITEKSGIYGMPSAKSRKFVEMEFQPNQLHVAQSTVTKDLVLKKMKMEPGDWELEFPVVVKDGSEFYIAAGNHMAVAQYLRDGHITARVTEYVSTGPRSGKYVKPGTVIGNRLLFLFGGAGSGFHGHKGRPGEVGGSSKGGGSSMDKVVLKDLSGATARAEHDGSIAIDPGKWKDVSDQSKKGILAHELLHQTVEDYVLNNNDEWDRAVEALQLEKNPRSPSGYLFIGGNTRIGEAIVDATSVYVVDGTFGREPSTDWRGWAADVVKKSGHSKKELSERVENIIRQANELL